MELDWDNIFMKCEYFIVVKTIQENRKTPIYFLVNNNEDCIGTIKWHGAWRKFCFFPEPDTLWDNKCLNDVQKVINNVTAIYKESKLS